MALTKTALIATLLTGLLGWTTPAWADDYSATTTIDLTTLTFSVVTTSYAPIRQKTLAFAKVGATEQANRAHDFGAVVTRNLTTTLAGTGNAAAVNDATHLSVVAHRTGSVGTLGMVEQAGELTATQTGVLTVSVNYTISHVLGSGATPSHYGGPTLLVQGAAGQQPQYASGQRNILTSGTEAGTLSVTRSVTQGQRLCVSVAAHEQAGTAGMPIQMGSGASGGILHAND